MGDRSGELYSLLWKIDIAEILKWEIHWQAAHPNPCDWKAFLTSRQKDGAKSRKSSNETQPVGERIYEYYGSIRLRVFGFSCSRDSLLYLACLQMKSFILIMLLHDCAKEDSCSTGGNPCYSWLLKAGGKLPLSASQNEFGSPIRNGTLGIFCFIC